jgi:hypothetical protein
MCDTLVCMDETFGGGNLKRMVPAGQWRTLRVVANGPMFEVYFNGSKLYDVEDKTFSKPGKVGVWTKTDSVRISDLTVVTSRWRRLWCDLSLFYRRTHHGANLSKCAPLPCQAPAWHAPSISREAPTEAAVQPASCTAPPKSTRLRMLGYARGEIPVPVPSKLKAPRRQVNSAPISFSLKSIRGTD